VASNFLPDASTPYGERVRARLRDETVIWMTTTGDDGTPQPNPVWFLWEDAGTILVYNRPSAQRVRHVGIRPRVGLHFNSSPMGGDVVVFTGRAEVVGGEPAPHDVPAYVAKYGASMKGISGSLEGFSTAYPVAVRVHPEKVRGF
jgi:PPOX class probable F420-dependent enzyme